eukprot:192407_1
MNQDNKEWLKELKVSDKLDVYKLYTGTWTVGRIIKIYNNQLLIYFSGKEKWMDIDNDKHIKRLNPLNSFAPFHQIIENENENKENNVKKHKHKRKLKKVNKCRNILSKQCIFCNKQYCTKCALIKAKPANKHKHNQNKELLQCKNCTIQLEYDK